MTNHVINTDFFPIYFYFYAIADNLQQEKYVSLSSLVYCRTTLWTHLNVAAVAAFCLLPFSHPNREDGVHALKSFFFAWWPWSKISDWWNQFYYINQNVKRQALKVVLQPVLKVHCSQFNKTTLQNLQRNLQCS